MNKTASIQLTPEIIVSPRLHRFIKRCADNLGCDIISLLQEEMSSNLKALQDYRCTMRKADKHGMSYGEYCVHAAKDAGLL